MKKEIKGFILGCTVTAVIGGGVAVASNATNIEVYPNNVSIYANGSYVDVPNFTYNDTTYVPLRAVLEKMDCYVGYDDTTKTVDAGNNFGYVTSSVPAYLNGSLTPYEMVFDMKQEKFFVDIDILTDGDFTVSRPSGGGLMFMDNDKYVAIDTTQSSPQPTLAPTPTPKPSKKTSGGINSDELFTNKYQFKDTYTEDSESQKRSAYESELKAINDRYDAMIEIIRSNYNSMGTPSSATVSLIGQQIQDYENQRQNEIDKLNAKYGY